MKKYIFILLTIIVTSIPSFKLRAQIFGPSFKEYVLHSPEKILEPVKSIALVGFYIQGPSEPSNFITDKSYGIFTARSETKEIKDDYKVDHGQVIMNHFETGLLNEKRGIGSEKPLLEAKTNIYSLVERSKIEQIAMEQKHSLSGMFDESTLPEIGKLAGADAILTVSGNYSYNDKVSKREKKKDGVVVGYSYSTTREVKTIINLKIVSVETGTLVHSKTVNNSVKKTLSGDKKGAKFGVKVNDLAAESFKNSVNSALNSFSPYYVQETFAIKKIKLKEFKDRAKSAQGYLKSKDYKKAFPIYKAIQEADPYNDLASYNLGALYEISGNYEKAKELYEVAAQFDESNKVYQKAYKRSVNGMDMLNSFKKLGIEFKDYQFNSITNSTLSARCKTKGNSKDRVNVYELDDKGSKIIAKLPGGKEFVIKEELNDFYLITGLLGGKEGYVSVKDAKKE
ncbi:MAG: CsgG/HfaB family protein [Cyclobacteriaceae bacterium]